MSAAAEASTRAKALLEDILENKRVRSSSGEDLELHSELPKEEGRLLQQWLQDTSPRSLLEIGCAYGVSSLYICEALAHIDITQYHVIDAFQSEQWSNVGRGHLEQAAPPGKLVFHEALSELCLPELLSQGQRFDFTFVDGWHSFDQVMLEFYYINRMLDVNGIIVFDDIHLQSQQKMMRYVSTYPAYQTLPPPEHLAQSLPAKVRRAAGVPAYRLQAFVKVADDDRSWGWFEDF